MVLLDRGRGSLLVKDDFLFNLVSTSVNPKTFSLILQWINDNRPQIFKDMLNYQDPETGNTAAHIAKFSNQNKIFEILTEQNGIDLSLVNNSDKTAINCESTFDPNDDLVSPTNFNEADNDNEEDFLGASQKEILSKKYTVQPISFFGKSYQISNFPKDKAEGSKQYTVSL